ncbi:MAG: hypothetical protein NT121_26280 [Chloroflexi bacterium]|nr:hypothetical protein [Chloroflexota bacterium]
MSKITKGSLPPKIAFKDRNHGNPSPGFQFVAVGLVAYILYAAKFFTFTWLYPVALVLVFIGFVLLIIETLAKIH